MLYSTDQDSTVVHLIPWVYRDLADYEGIPTVFVASADFGQQLSLRCIGSVRTKERVGEPFLSHFRSSLPSAASYHVS